jgi:hypothetical protein
LAQLNLKVRTMYLYYTMFAYATCLGSDLEGSDNYDP